MDKVAPIQDHCIQKRGRSKFEIQFGADLAHNLRRRLNQCLVGKLTLKLYFDGPVYLHFNFQLGYIKISKSFENIFSAEVHTITTV